MKTTLLKVFLIPAMLSTLVACSSGSSSGGGTTNTTPIATSTSESLPQDSTAFQIALSANDADGDTLTYSISSTPSNGSATVSGATVTYTPASNYSGADSFTFKVNDGTQDSNVATVNLTVQPIAKISGRLIEANGNVVANSPLEIIDASGNILETIQSDTNGVFLVTGLTGQELVIRATSSGHASQVTPVKLPDLKSSTIPLDIVMIARGGTQTIDIDVGGTLQGSDGASVTLSPGTFVDAAGNAVTGNITATMTPVDVSNTALLSAFPGNFAGIVETTGAESPIASLGTVEYVFKDSNGEKIQLMTGTTADIEIPIFITTNPQTGNAVEIGDSIDLWYLNEVTGIWKQEGSGVVVVNTSSPTGLALKATVSHFSWWNCDVTYQPGKVTVTVTAASGITGTAVLNARTDVNIGFRPSQVSMNVQIGQTTSPMFIASGGETCLWVDYMIGGSTASSPEQCISTVAANGMYSLTFAHVSSTAPLEIATSNVSASYNSFVPFSPIAVFPYSLESAVSYVVTSGALPAGLVLNSSSGTLAKIQGIPTVTGSFPITIQGTDSDGNTNSVTLTIDIVNPPTPTLDSSLVINAVAAATVTQDLTAEVQQSSNVPNPTSWSITNPDGSAVATNVSVSSAGVLTVSNYDGIAATYHVMAYSVSGGSNVLAVNLAPLAPPLLETPKSYTHTFDSSMNIGSFTNELYIQTNTFNSGGAVTSWSISPSNGNPFITGSGGISYHGGNPGVYSVTATNAAGNSVMMLTLQDDPIDCAIDPGNAVCTMAGPCTDPADPLCSMTCPDPANPDPALCF